jgi:hypothetical protein
MQIKKIAMMKTCFRLFSCSIIVILLISGCLSEKGLVEQESNFLVAQNDSLPEKAGLSVDSGVITIAPNTAIKLGDQKRKDLGALRDFKGKYPYEIKLFEHANLRFRLKALLGDERYAFIKRLRQVESPIEIEDGLLYSWAMQAHSGGNPSAVILFDFNTDILYVGIRKNNVSTVYSEDGSKAPQKLVDWTNEPTFEELMESGAFMIEKNWTGYMLHT